VSDLPNAYGPWTPIVVTGHTVTRQAPEIARPERDEYTCPDCGDDTDVVLLDQPGESPTAADWLGPRDTLKPGDVALWFCNHCGAAWRSRVTVVSADESATGGKPHG